MPARSNRAKSKVGNDYGSSSRAAARAVAERTADERTETDVEQRDAEGTRRLDDFITLSRRFSVVGFGRVRPHARTCACRHKCRPTVRSRKTATGAGAEQKPNVACMMMTSLYSDQK